MVGRRNKNAGDVDGTRWWSTIGEIQPVTWELEVREKKTKKLLKKLPKTDRAVSAEEPA